MRAERPFSRFVPLISLLLLASLAPSVSAQAYVEFVGDLSGHIPGSVAIPPEEGNSEILSFSSSVHQTYDSATGLPTGYPFYQPALLYKTYDQATVPLYDVQRRNEAMDISIRMYGPDGQGATQHFYTIELQGAHIVGIEDRLDPDTVFPYQIYFLTFDVIRWTDEDTGAQTSMTWGASATNVDLAKSESKLLPLPNPTARATTLRFDLPESVPAQLVVYDLHGRVVRRLYDGVTPAEQMAVSWNGDDDDGTQVARGVYLVKLRWPEGEIARKVTLLR